MVCLLVSGHGDADVLDRRRRAGQALRAEGAGELRDALAVKYTGQTYAEGNPDAAARYEDVDMVVVRVAPERVVGLL
jgi:hypothetical protein